MRVKRLLQIVSLAISLLVILALTGCNHANAESRPTGLTPYKSILYGEDSEENRLGIKEIVLLTDAQKGEDGKFLFDDGQNFTLRAVTATDEIDILPLNYYQLATIDFHTFIKTDTNTFCVLVHIPGNATYRIEEYEYRTKKKTFVKTEIYNSGTINYYSHAPTDR